MLRTKSAKSVEQSQERGYSMVILIMAVMALTVLTAVALPTWTSISQREKEEELIFRGLQYAEAIRVFQRRFGRYPVRLKELVEVKPRSIRQLYPDPMDEEAEWGLIFATANNRNRQGGRQQQTRGEASNQQSEQQGTLPKSELLQSSNLFGKKKQAVGPISGVYSKSSAETTFKVFMDQEQYEQWAFSVDLVSGVSNTPDRPPQVPSARTLGRPFRDGVTPLISFTQPNNNSQGRGRAGNNQGPAGVRPNQNPGQGQGLGRSNAGTIDTGPFGVPQGNPRSNTNPPKREE